MRPTSAISALSSISLLVGVGALVLSCSSNDDGPCSDVGDICACGDEPIPDGIEKCPASKDCCARGADGCACAAPKFLQSIAKSCDEWVALDNSTRVPSCP
ncbi:MAG: hypothetical protein IPI67_35780 [Myxococcales bacterium]|nr:hypothetical protein [Myxococcales bacterium]